MQYWPTVVAMGRPYAITSTDSRSVLSAGPGVARPWEVAGENYVLISADCHGGGDIAHYRPYLESRYHDDFDAWAATFENPFDDVAGDDGDRNWDSARRLRELEADGIVAEVVF